MFWPRAIRFPEKRRTLRLLLFGVSGFGTLHVLGSYTIKPYVGKYRKWQYTNATNQAFLDLEYGITMISEDKMFIQGKDDFNSLYTDEEYLFVLQTDIIIASWIT